MLKDFARYPLAPALHSPHLPPQWVMQGGSLAAGVGMSDQHWQFPIDGHLDWTGLSCSYASKLKPL